MNPQAIREAIKDGLDARAAWDDTQMFAYPAGDKVTKSRLFQLFGIRDGNAAMLDLSGLSISHQYILEGRITVLGGTGAKDSHFATNEATALALLADMELWLVAVDHGKTLGVATCDVLELIRWNATPGVDGSCVIDVDLAISETETIAEP